MFNDALAATDTTWANIQLSWVVFAVTLALVAAAVILIGVRQGGDKFLAGLLGLTVGAVAGLAAGGAYSFIAGDAATRSNTAAIVSVLQDKYGATVNEGALYTQVWYYRDNTSAPATIDDVALETPEGPVVVQLMFPNESPSSVVALRTTPPGAELPLVSEES